jgi:membrane protease YdiL (CAAX protease family)
MLSLVAVLAIEFLLVFFVAPTVFACTRHRIPAIPALWVLLAYCLFILLHDPQFDRRRLWDTAGLRQFAPAILSLFAVAVVIGIALVLRYAPAVFLNLPRSNPLFWSLVMVLYPVLSVYPQGIVYRAFVFDRYRELFGPSWGIVLASATAFAYVHIVFRNPLALGLTFLAGLLFAIRYLQTGSLLVTSFEHALYGCAIFTIGLGRWFYYGAVPR